MNVSINSTAKEKQSVMDNLRSKKIECILHRCRMRQNHEFGEPWDKNQKRISSLNVKMRVVEAVCQYGEII